MSFCRILQIIIFLALLTGCAQKPPTPLFSDWVYTDLLELDAPITSPAPTAAPDLLAIYTRQTQQDIQIRLDFFDHSQLSNFDLYLAFDAIPGGRNTLPIDVQPAFDWDSLIILPASGEIQVLDPRLQTIPGARLQVFRDPVLDTLTLGMSHSVLPTGSPNWRVQAWVTLPGSRSVVDALPLARSGGRPPQPVRVLMAFSQTYPAYTPALALRRWDGAHTGPSGGRHGLANILRTASANQVPIVLLDLMNPASLSALDYLGGLDQIRELQAQGLVVLPQVMPAFPGSALSQNPSVTSLLNEISAEGVSGFNLYADDMVYIPSGVLADQTHARVIFLGQTGVNSLAPVHPTRWQQSVVIPVLGVDAPQQASPQGPTFALRQALASAAASAQTSDNQALLVLGGDLPASAWGDPQSARATLRYLRSRPWIQFVDEQDLNSLRGVKTTQAGNARPFACLTNQRRSAFALRANHPFTPTSPTGAAPARIAQSLAAGARQHAG